MNGKVFVDTNVLVYAYDPADAGKQSRAREVLDRLASNDSGWLSAQVLAEFFTTVTRKIQPALAPEEAMSSIQNYILSWNVVPITPGIVLEAAKGVLDHQLHFWDAQIWAAARLNQIPLVLSEDFANGTVLEGVRILDPFRPAFRPESLSPI